MNYDDIDLSLFQLFYLVCQNRSFSKTAEYLGVTQPSISYNIKKLEDELGVKLFERGNVLQLTPEAEAILPYVESAINSLKAGEHKVRDIVNLKKGQISVGVPSHIGVFFLTNIIKEFNKEYPNIKMKIVCKTTKELFHLLNVNELDAVIDCSPLDDNVYDFVIVKIAKEKCAFVCHEGQKELLDRVVKLKELENYPLIVPLKTSGSTKELIKVFEKNERILDPAFEVTTSDMIAEMIEKKLGVGYLFEKTVNSYPKLKKIELSEKLPVFDIFLIYKDRSLSVTTNTFIEFVLKNIKVK